MADGECDGCKAGAPVSGLPDSVRHMRVLESLAPAQVRRLLVGANLHAQNRSKTANQFSGRMVATLVAAAGIFEPCSGMIVQTQEGTGLQTGEFTILLRQCSNGDRQAMDALTPVIYAELKKLAVACMRQERPGATLQPTALVHEAYLQLVAQDLPDFQNRAHFFGVTARIMRQILISNARRRCAQKRGGGHRGEMPDDLPIPMAQSEELLAVDEALERLAAQDERKAKVVELKYFGGLAREEIAEVLGLNLATVKRDIALGEAWLRRALASGPPE